jgi:hypothetical protein
MLPQEYEMAVVALKECTEFPEAKYWHDKAEALAAWAKVYHDEQIDHWARQLRLRASRRMGELSRELRPATIKRDGARANGRNPGHIQLMIDQGLKRSEAVVASAIAKVPNYKFERALQKKVPPAPSSFLRRGYHDSSETWKMLREGSRNPLVCSSFIQANPPVRTAHALSKDEARVARTLLKELREWINKFEEALEGE